MESRQPISVLHWPRQPMGSLRSLLERLAFAPLPQNLWRHPKQHRVLNRVLKRLRHESITTYQHIILNLDTTYYDYRLFLTFVTRFTFKAHAHLTRRLP